MDLEQAIKYRDNYEQNVREAADYLRQFVGQFLHETPEFGITLGSGLGELADSIEDPVVVSYNYIPNHPVCTVPGHEGAMYIGKLEGVPVIGLKGRKHFYEVADDPLNTGILQTTFSVQVLAELGVPNYFATNAAGGLNLEYEVGDVMIIKTHINNLPNPLLGRKHEFKRVDTGDTWRFQPMNGAYNRDLRALLTVAGEDDFDHLHAGTLVSVTGPSFETEGESLMFRDYADAVGMSVIPEVIVARNRGMNCVAFSCITNKIAEDGTNATNHEEVTEILASSEVKRRLSGLVRNFFDLYRRNDGRT